MEAIRLERLSGSARDQAALQRLFENSADYSWRVTGRPPAPGDAESALTALPDGKGYDDKFVYGIFRGERIVGCVDLVRAYPDPSTAFLGLLLIAESERGMGVGAEACRLVEGIVASWESCRKLRLGVVRTNEVALPFWQKQGFRETGEVKPYQCHDLHSETVLMEKALPAVESHRGSCLCGGVTFQVRGALTNPSACHCRQCRKHSGHYEASVDLPRASLTVSGAEKITWFLSTEKNVRRGFCSVCGSSLFWDPIGRDWTSVAMGAFDTPTNTRLVRHIYVADKGDYYEIADGLPQNAQ